jgi:hypothetical protein
MGQRSTLFELGNGFADHAFFQDLPAICHSYQQGRSTELVNWAGNAFGVNINAARASSGKSGLAL